jgi:hypothetical protein
MISWVDAQNFFGTLHVFQFSLYSSMAFFDMEWRMELDRLLAL